MRFFSPAQRQAQWGRGRALSKCLTCANNMEPWQGERALGAPYPLHPGPLNSLLSHPLYTSSSTVCLGATRREAGMLVDPQPPHPSSLLLLLHWPVGKQFRLHTLCHPLLFLPPPPLFLKLARLFCSSDRIWFWVSTKGQCAIVLEGFWSLRLHPTHTSIIRSYMYVYTANGSAPRAGRLAPK